MSESLDIFSKWETALWNVLEGHPPLAALVGFNNRVRMTDPDKDQPFKPSPSSADLPELLMIPTDGEALTVGTSSSSFAFVQRFQIIVSSDQLRTNRDRSPNPIKAAIFGALLGCRDALPGCGTNLVRPVKWTDTIGERGEEDGPRVAGWQCAITVEVSASRPRSEWQ